METGTEVRHGGGLSSALEAILGAYAYLGRRIWRVLVPARPGRPGPGAD